MPTYVLMTKLEPVCGEDAPSRRERGQQWKASVEKLCPKVKWIAHYALLGPYDFMDIYEAPSEAVAFQISLLSRAQGAASAESWPAMLYADFLPLMERVEST